MSAARRMIQEAAAFPDIVADPLDAAKAAAARYAVAHRVRAGQRIALGTGSTAAHAVQALAAQFPEGRFDCVASSEATARLARSLGLAVRAPEGGDRFDLMLDGADEVSPRLDLTKGGGGALFREKLLARRSRELVILVDPSKLVQSLGERHRIPLEVVPFARPFVEQEVASVHFRAHRRLMPDGRAYLTDNGNEILDLAPTVPLTEPAVAEQALRAIPGVVESGLFVGLAHLVVVGRPDGSVEARPRRPGPTDPSPA